MKKRLVFLYPATCILLIFIVVLFCINLLKKEDEKNKQQIQEQKQEQEEKDLIENKSNQTIRVKLCKTGEIVAMDMNDYIRGVLPSEMPPSYDIEALKAQALVARTFTYRKMQEHAEGPDADICDNSGHCQAFYMKDKLFDIWAGRGFDEATRTEYWKKVNEAVVATQNQAIVYQGQYIKAFFHASSPEKTENIDQIWGGEKLPYLVSVDNKESEDYANRTSIIGVPCEEMLAKLKEESATYANLTVEDVKKTSICDYTTSGRVKNIQVGNCKVSAEKLRTLFGLKSTNFTIELQNENTVIFHVVGYGHGVGLSQVGADYLAKQGMKYEDIIKYYYKGVEIKTFS